MSQKNRPLAIAHRGASGNYPENSLLAFEKAIELKVDWIEFDIQYVNQEFWVFHDTTLTRLTGRKEKLSQLSRTEIQSVDIGKGEKIPTLTEVLSLTKDRMKINIEIKGFAPEDSVIARMKALLSDGWSKENLLISSFNHHLLKATKLALPALSVAPLFGGFPLNEFETIKALGSEYVGIDLKLACLERVQGLENQGIKTLIYTVNENEEIKEIHSWGTSGIISNYPERVIRIREGTN